MFKPAAIPCRVAVLSLLLAGLMAPACARLQDETGQAQPADAAGAVQGDVYVEAGQAGLRNGRATVAQHRGGRTLDASLESEYSGNYRDGSDFRQLSFSGGAEWKLRNGRYGASADSVQQDTRYPAPPGLFSSALVLPLQQRPEDRYAYDVRRVSAFAQRYLGNIDLGVELSQREKSATASYVGDSGSYRAAYRSEQTQIAPRLRHYGKWGSVKTDTELGVDVLQWRRRSSSVSPYGAARAGRRQQSVAVLLREELLFAGPHATRLLFGLRHEHSHLDADERVQGGAWARRNAWDIQASHDLAPQWTVHGKAARSFRIDDDGYTSAGYRPLAGQMRLEEEAGLTWGNTKRSVAARVFRERLSNQIVFDQNLGQQGYVGNLEPGRRSGLVLDAGMDLGRDWRLTGQLQQVSAQFDDYPYNGPDIALVARTLATMRLYWTPQGASSADLGVQWLRALPYGNDFDNSCLAQVPRFAMLDGRYAYKSGAWELALTGSNLTNRRHYGDAPACRSSIYQNDARQLRLSLRYRF